jgi:hypothetical protein
MNLTLKQSLKDFFSEISYFSYFKTWSYVHKTSLHKLSSIDPSLYRTYVCIALESELSEKLFV